MSFSRRMSLALAAALVALSGCVESPAPAALPPAKEVVAKSTVTPIAPAPVAAPGEIVDKGFDDIKFDMVKGDPFRREMLTPKIEALFGQRIRIRGFILPPPQRKGLKKFVLVRDNMECCFGPGAALFDCIVVDMDPGQTAEFSIRPIAVEGVLTLEEIFLPTGKHLAIYHLQASSAG